MSARHVVVAIALFVAACQASAAPGAQCARASDCPTPLVCAIGRCRAACTQSRDCPTLARCLVEPSSGAGVCSLTQVDDCTTHDCPLHFACRSGACVNVCADILRCPDGRCDANGCTPVIGDAGPAVDGGLDAPMTTTWTLSITDDADDGEVIVAGTERAVYIDGENGDQIDYAGQWSGAPTWAFVRYAVPGAIPPGARVLDARLRVSGLAAAGLVTTDDGLAITGERSADAPAITARDDVPGGLNGRVGTTAVVRWPALGNWAIGDDISPDLSPIVQELVDQPGGLASRAHVVLWLDAADYAQDGEVSFQDTTQTVAGPTLTITWSM